MATFTGCASGDRARSEQGSASSERDEDGARDAAMGERGDGSRSTNGDASDASTREPRPARDASSTTVPSTVDGGASAEGGATVEDDGGLPPPIRCGGKALPPRAYAKPRPFAIGPEAFGLPAYWPTAGFRSESAERLGFDGAKLASAVDYRTPYSSTQAVIVVRHGYVAVEKYLGSFTARTQHESYSVAKSFTSALVGIAIAEGKLTSTDDKVCTAYPMQWNCADASDPRSRITVDHAMNLSTGLMWREDWRSTAVPPNDAYSPALLDSALARRAVEEPGQTKRYSTGDPALLSGVLQQATGMTVYEYGREKIFDVIGTPGVRWNSDSKGRTTSHAGLQATAIDYAKFGYLYLRRGVWEDKQVVPADWVDRTTQAKDPCADWNQYLWHVNPPVRLGDQDPACPGLFCPPTSFADLPADGFFAQGINGQFVFVVPSADLVVVRLANDMPGSERWDQFARAFLGALLDAIKE